MTEVGRRWNGWGDAAIDAPLQARRPGLSSPRRSASRHPRPTQRLIDALAQVEAQPSRLPAHRLVDTRAEARLRASFGQSGHDWLRLRFGVLGRLPDGVALPDERGEVRDAARLGARARRAGDSLAAAPPAWSAISRRSARRPVLTLNLGRMTRLLELDPVSRLARFEAGVAGPDLEAQLRAHGFTLGHFPQTFEHSTLGGWVVTRSSGQQSPRYGRIEQLFAGGALQTPGGEWRLPAFPASAAGPDLREWVLGSEGRLGVITEADGARLAARRPRSASSACSSPTGRARSPRCARSARRGCGLSMLRLANPSRDADTTLRWPATPAPSAALERYLALARRRRGQVPADRRLQRRHAAAQVARDAAPRRAHLARARRACSTGTVLGAKWAARASPASTCATRCGTPATRSTRWRPPATGRASTRWCTALEAAGRAALAHARRARALLHPPVARLRAGRQRVHRPSSTASAPTTTSALARWRSLKEAVSDAIVAQGGTITPPARRRHATTRRWLAAEKGAAGMASPRLRATHRDRALRPATACMNRAAHCVRAPRRRAREPRRRTGSPATGGLAAAACARDCGSLAGRSAAASPAPASLLEARARGRRGRCWSSSATSPGARRRRSSKLVHGGLRYLREGRFALTRESVRERGRLLPEAPGLVEPQRS